MASEQTVYADGAGPGYLEGYGVIDAEQVRQLAAAASLLVANPVTSPVEALRYQPSAALERAVRCRDLTCRFPGCSRPAMVCDLDHTVPFNHHYPAAGGRTVAENLKCLCRQHHRLKTFGGWRDEQLVDGTVIWTSPTGTGIGLPPRVPICFPSRAVRHVRRRRENDEAAPDNEAGESHRRANTIVSSGRSTPPGVSWNRTAKTKSLRASSETTCATCFSCSRERRAPARTAPG